MPQMKREKDYQRGFSGNAQMNKFDLTFNRAT